MNDREKWRERARDIRASSTTWWWWFFLKVNAVVQLEYELTYPDVAIQRFSYYTIKTPHLADIYIYIYILWRYCDDMFLLQNRFKALTFRRLSQRRLTLHFLHPHLFTSTRYIKARDFYDFLYCFILFIYLFFFFFLLFFKMVWTFIIDEKKK